MSSKLGRIDENAFRVEDVSGELSLQLSLSLMLFFERGMERFGKQVLALWDDLLAWNGREVFTWARLGGGNKSRKADTATFRTIQAWLNGTRSFGETLWIEIHGGEYQAIGPYGFGVTGNDPTDRWVSSLDVRLPLSVLQSESNDALVQRLCGLAAHIDFLGGTAGLMLEATPFGREDYWPRMKNLVLRYEGVEPDMAEDGQTTAEYGLTGVNWLTFVGSKHLERLGGAARVKAAAAEANKGVSVLDVGHGIALRAGPWPRLGDRNAPSTELEPYKAVYEIVKDAIFADPKYPFDARFFEGDETVEWMHRFGRP